MKSVNKLTRCCGNFTGGCFFRFPPGRFFDFLFVDFERFNRTSFRSCLRLRTIVSTNLALFVISGCTSNISCFLGFDFCFGLDNRCSSLQITIVFTFLISQKNVRCSVSAAEYNGAQVGNNLV